MMKRMGLLVLLLLLAPLGRAQSPYYGTGGGALTSPVATDPLSFTGAVTFDNAANTPLVCSDGLSAPAAAAGVDGADLYLYATDGNPSTSDQNGGSIVLQAGSGISDQAGDADGGGIQLNPGAGTGAGVAGEVTVAANRNFCVGGGSGSASGICIGSSAITGEGSSADGNEGVLAFGNASADNTLTFLATASGVELNPTTGRLLTAAGTGTGRVSVGGVICKSATPVATTGTAEEILATCALPAGTMTVAGGYIRYQVEAVTAANTNNKTLKIYLSASGGGLGGNVCFTTPASASNNELWIPSAPGVMFPATATTGRCSFNLWRGAKGGTAALTAMPYHTDQIAQTWANALEIVISGTTPTAAGDLTLNGYTFEVVQ